MNHLSFGPAYRALAVASLEEDDILQDMWARLLTNAVDPNKATDLRRAFVDLLEALGPAEAGLLHVLSHIDLVSSKPLPKTDGDNSAEAAALRVDEVKANITGVSEEYWRAYSPDDQGTAVQNLVRLRCIGIVPRAPNVSDLFVRGDEGQALVNPGALATILEYFERQLLGSAGLVEAPATKAGRPQVVRQFGRLGEEDVPELRYRLTPLGKSLMRACSPGGI